MHTQFDDGSLDVKMDEHPLESTIKFDCDVGIDCEVTISIFASSVVVLSLIYQFLDFILKSSGTSVKYELDSLLKIS